MKCKIISKNLLRITSAVNLSIRLCQAVVTCWQNISINSDVTQVSQESTEAVRVCSGLVSNSKWGGSAEP
ncbi:hypothetical protein HBH43_051450 [Parastagonospora nodorum]|nr:hypothetical protein HBH43_051450 [Parastagonospora nodorum]